LRLYIRHASFKSTEAIFKGSKFYIKAQLLTSETVTKVFHDITEDCSLLSNLYKIDCKNIFDTQIAHRMCYEAIVGTSIFTKHSNISLGDLIKEYFNIENPVKDEISEIMKNNIYFWKTVN
jgi:ribonuclease D